MPTINVTMSTTGNSPVTPVTSESASTTFGYASTGPEAEAGGLSEEYQLAASVAAIVGISVLIIILVVLLVYRKNRGLQMATARQQLVRMAQDNYVSQVTFNQKAARAVR